MRFNHDPEAPRSPKSKPYKRTTDKDRRIPICRNRILSVGDLEIWILESMKICGFDETERSSQRVFLRRLINRRNLQSRMGEQRGEALQGQDQKELAVVGRLLPDSNETKDRTG